MGIKSEAALILAFCMPALLYFALPPPPAAGMDWPDADASMVHNFGWNDEGRPAVGISFDSEGPVYPAGGGELIFIHSGGSSASGLPSPLGSWAALDHGDGLISIYAYLDGGQMPSGHIFDGTAPIGSPGRSDQGGFYFSIFDRKEHHWVNPSMVIASGEDTQQPVIRSVFLKDPEGNLVNPAQIRNIAQGTYTIYVDAVDTSRRNSQYTLAPHRISCSVNGIASGMLQFETLAARNGTLFAEGDGPVPARQVYEQAPLYRIGSALFTRGQAVLELIVNDIAGNSRSVSYRLLVE